MSDQPMTQYEAPAFHPLALMPRNQVEALGLAKMMADSTLVPTHLQKKPSDCLMVVMQAHRWGMDPFAVAQCTSVVHSRLCYEGKLVAAALYAANKLDGRFEYEITGEGQNSSIKVTGTIAGTGKPVSVGGNVKQWRTVSYPKGADGKPDKSRTVPNNWDNDPHSMLVYRGTRQWARIYCPEVMLGVNTPDEIDDAEPEPITVTPLPQRAAPAAATTAQPDPSGFEPPKTKPGPAPKKKDEPAAPIEGEFVPAATAQADARVPADLAPFDDPNPGKPAAAPAESGEFRLPPNGDGDALTTGMARILENKCKAAGIGSTKLAAKYPVVNRGNLGAILDWLQSGAVE